MYIYIYVYWKINLHRVENSAIFYNIFFPHRRISDNNGATGGGEEKDTFANAFFFLFFFYIPVGTRGRSGGRWKHIELFFLSSRTHIGTLFVAH